MYCYLLGGEDTILTYHEKFRVNRVVFVELYLSSRRKTL